VSETGLLLGIDTGGTFTDAVLYDEARRLVVATAKSPTTHDDLSIGINGAIDAVLAAGSVDPARIELVSLSTTLATNALVEGRGRSVALVLIGFEPEVIDRGGLRDALGGDPVMVVAGGHDSHGSAIVPLDVEALTSAVDNIAANHPTVEGFAVAGQFSVRNPAHEVAARDLIRFRTHRPVSCSHELSAKLNGPKRAVTAVLNARLIAIIDQLVTTTRSTLAARGIDAPLMVVRGDGSLVSADFVSERPIETILSGPAASLVGAAHLTGLTDAVISDIGGTTTDIAVLRAGVPVVSDEGATVGGHRTMVTAVSMYTHGLGGDSEVRQDERSTSPLLRIGPRRVIPLSLLAADHGDFLHRVFDQQLNTLYPTDLAGVFLVPTAATAAWTPTTAAERELLDAVADGPAVAMDVVTTSTKRGLVDRFVRLGVLKVSAFTPTDACHVLGLHSHFDVDIARKAADMFARHRDGRGKAIAPDGAAVSQLVVDTLVRRSAEAVLGAAFAEDGLSSDLVASALVQRDLDRSLSVVNVGFGLGAPLVGLGASAATYYPAVAELLRTTSVVPEHAAVANAVGAVVGRVSLRCEITISSPSHGQFLVHLGDTPTMFVSLDDARAAASAYLQAQLRHDMVAAGAGAYETSDEWVERTAEVSGLIMFVEGTLTVLGTGRPDLSRRDGGTR
jgi:N-methylhydantoinase A/oxoprolinase/acetone carboxylase beta subunit